MKAIGFKAAYTSAHQSFDYTSFNIEPKRRAGFNVAGFVEWLDLPFFSIVSQIEYAQRGMRYEIQQTGPGGPEIIAIVTRYNRVDYLSIPLFAKFSLPAHAISPFLSLGPRFDILLGYKSDEDAYNFVYDDFKKTMLGGTISIGCETNALLPFSLILEARYNFDLADSYATQSLKVRNSSIDIWMGAAF